MRGKIFHKRHSDDNEPFVTYKRGGKPNPLGSATANSDHKPDAKKGAPRKSDGTLDMDAIVRAALSPDPAKE